MASLLVSDSGATLPAADAGSPLHSAYQAVLEALDPAAQTLGLHLLMLRSVIEANQVHQGLGLCPHHLCL